MKKLLLLILALALTLSLLTACQGKKQPPVVNNDDDGEDELTIAEVLGFDKQNYNKEFKVLLNEQNKRDFEAEEGNADRVIAATYDRNLACEEYLGIEINYDVKPGHYNSTMCKDLYDSIAAGSCDYDLVAMGLNTGIIGGYIDIYQNIMQMDYLEPSHSWWVQEMIEQISINNRLYFITGDACITTWTHIGCIFANLQVAENFNLDVDFYEMVDNGEWTIDKFITLFKNVEKDENGDGTIDSATETYGWCNYNIGARLMWSAANVQLVERQSDGTFAAVQKLDQRTIDFVAKLKGAYDDPRHDYIGSGDKASSAFVENRVLFVSFMLAFAETLKTANIESAFAILPMPKYDTDQSDYISTAMSAYNALFFPISMQSPDMSAQVAEFMGWYGQDTIIPEYYDQTLKYRQNDVEQNIEMLDLIREKLRVSPTETFGVISTGGTDAIAYLSQLTDTTAGRTDHFYANPVSYWDTNLPAFKAQIKDYVMKYYNADLK